MRNWTSDLEQEFELEFGDISLPDRLGEFEDSDDEFEIDGNEEEASEDGGIDLDHEFEAYGSSDPLDEYVERFMELSSRTYESETELNGSVEKLLGEIEREYFWGALKRAAKRGLRAGVGRLVSTAKGLAKNHPLFKSLQGLTSLHRGGLRSMLGQLATAAASATPYGGAITSAMKALNFDPGAPTQEREAWENYVNVAREAYEDLAENFEETQSITGAQQQAARAFTNAVQKHGRGGRRDSRGERRVIHLRPGEKITIVCSR